MKPELNNNTTAIQLFTVSSCDCHDPARHRSAPFTMRQILGLLSLLACLLRPVVGPLPTKEELCDTVVDIEVKKACLECFNSAGTLQESPDDFRFCVGSYLPQKLADCSVPHHEQSRMQHGKPNLHPNHTNANLMPRCLTKSLERLERYLERENIIARSGGKIVKAVATSTLVKDGGPALVGIVAQHNLLQQSEVKAMVDSVASECVTKYHKHHGSGKADGKGSRRMSLRTLQKALTLDPEEEDVEEDDEEAAEGWSVRWPQGNAGAGNAGAGNAERTGNNLPFDGVGQLAEPILKGQCIVEKLISNDYGYELISIMGQDEFFLPIPSWWLRPLLVYYKNYRENFENGRHV
ncbi:uncharacterized protein LOC125031847 [Penaeus chinensis]|uniref:uncharacterized protein LOC125031847 n=1 Tax=Penaeus chinensis TaxID=139456 RepID=UPI001FB5B63B|nr:uncharacterized protein LOC125031847 [Penaeus chinensis]